jgi:amidase
MSEQIADSRQQTREGGYTPKDPVNAFCSHGPFMVHGKVNGPLTSLRFAGKELLDVEGYVTGCGNPDWLRTRGPATKSASTIQALVDAGASMIAKTHTDELAYSLNGENAHYGTPINSRAPGRIPGGSDVFPGPAGA